LLCSHSFAEELVLLEREIEQYGVGDSVEEAAKPESLVEGQEM
jgi:hypothetical protein